MAFGGNIFPRTNSDHFMGYACAYAPIVELSASTRILRNDAVYLIGLELLTVNKLHQLARLRPQDCLIP